MAELNWEKKSVAAAPVAPSIDRLKFGVVGVVLFGLIAFLLISGTTAGGRYFMTVENLLSRTELHGKTVKISGAVIGSTISVDGSGFQFTMAHLTDDMNQLSTDGGLAAALHKSVSDPAAKRLSVVVKGQAKPDLLQNEAQAILTGKLGADGVFYADEILLKCPSKYQGEVPKQT
jgi:cytochrome c-type biogenesis protein CcmE